MVSRPAAHRLLRAYLATGLAFSLAVGIGVVVVLRGYTTQSVSSFWRPVLDIALGAAASGYAVGVGIRRRSAPSRTQSRTGAWLQHRLDDLTTTRAALIGLVTHLPGLIYLAALNAIVGSAPSPVSAVAQVVTYNVIWYSVGIAAFLVTVFRPSASEILLEKADAIAHRHGRSIVVAVFGIIGVYLLGKGLATLRGW